MKILKVNKISKDYKILLILTLVLLIIPLFFFNFLSNNIIGNSGDPVGVLAEISQKTKYFNQYDYQTKYYSNNINYPFGNIIIPDFFYDFIIFYFLTKIFPINIIFLYNYLIILSFPLTFLTTYLLSKHIFKKISFAVISALIFTFTNFHLGESFQHLSQAHIQWIPLLFLSLLLLNEKRNIKYAILTALSFSILFFGDLYYGYFSIFFLIIFFVFNLAYCYLKNKKYDLVFLKYFGLFIIFSLGIMAPFLVNAFSILIINTQTMIVRPLIDVQHFSINILNFIFPTKQIFLNINWYKEFIQRIGVRFSNSYIGVLTIVVSLASFLNFKKSIKISNEPKVSIDKKWSINTSIIFLNITIIFMILIGLPPEIKPFGITIKTLSYYIYKAFPIVRVYERIIIFIWLAISLLFPVGLFNLLESIRKKYIKVLTLCIIIPILLFDYSYKPIIQRDINTIPDQYLWLMKDKSNYGIAEFDFNNNIWLNYLHYKTLYYQQFHNKKIFNSPSLGADDDFHKDLNTIQSPAKSKVLGFLGIKYIIINCNKQNELINNLKQNNNIEFQYLDNNNLIYKIKNYIYRPDISIPRNIIYTQGNLLSLYTLLDFNNFNKDSVIIFSELESDKNSAINNSNYIIIPYNIESIETTEYNSKIENYSFNTLNPITIYKENDQNKAKISFSIINSGSALWINDTDNPVRGGYEIYKISNNKESLIDGGRYEIKHHILPDESISLELYIDIPNEPANYRLSINLLKENKFWFKNNEINVFFSNNFSKIDKITYPKNTYDFNKHISYSINIPTEGDYYILINRSEPYVNTKNTKIKIDNNKWEQIEPEYLNLEIFDNPKLIFKKVNLKSGIHKLQFSNIDFAIDSEGKRLTDSFVLMKINNSEYFASNIAFLNKDKAYDITVNNKLDNYLPIFINLPFMYDWKFKVNNEIIKLEKNIGNGYGLLIWVPNADKPYTLNASY